MSKGISILIVEDEPVTAISLRTRLQIQGHTVIGVAATGEEAFRLARTENPDLVLLDVSLAGHASGIDVASRIQQQLPETRFAFLTASDDPAVLARIKQLQPAAVLHKPLDDDFEITLDNEVLSL